MNRTAIYLQILKESKKLYGAGAIDTRGRKPKDRDQVNWSIEVRAWSMALKNMPASIRKQWLEHIKSDQLAGSRSDAAQSRAYRRGVNRLVSDGLNTEVKVLDLSAIRLQAIRPAQEARRENNEARMNALVGAIECLSGLGKRITSKTVARELARVYGDKFTVRPDTLRKDIYKIRHGRHKE